ncbi:hypothetical protein [Deinococcus aluminii]|uniref:DUF5709 domain-containing protein n=1 Tax=Deinococcus aluminii TaxID=1656885 RepID=A0ABP9XBV0_9DEIO
MTRTPPDDANEGTTGPTRAGEDQAASPDAGTPPTVDYSLPRDDNPEQQDIQSNAHAIYAAEADREDLPVSGDVTAGRDLSGTDALAGAGITFDDGIEPSLRTEMLDNAIAYSENTPPANVNDEPGFDDGVPNSFSDFSVVTADIPGGTTRLADPSFDAGGEVKGPRIGGSGGIDGGPPRTRPLPGTEEADEQE